MKRSLPLLILLANSIFILPSCNSNNNVAPTVNVDRTLSVSPADHKDNVPVMDTVGTVAEEQLAFNTSAVGNFLKDSFLITLANGKAFQLAVPKGFKINVAAEGLNRLRFLALSPDKRLFATDMFDRSDNNKGRVIIFENWNEEKSSFANITTWLDNLHNPNQVAFYKGYIYIAETHQLTRYAYEAGSAKPSAAAEIISTFPSYGLSYKYGGWHLTRSISFNNNKLYVSVGSSCNACIEKEEIRASVLEMDPDGKNPVYFARGLRNSVGLKWIKNQLWVTTMGRDLIGPDKPEDLFLQVKKDGYYGWPFYFQYQGKVYADDQFRDSVKASFVKQPPVGFAGFKAHSAPLGFEYFERFDDALLKDRVLVCLHGSTSVWRERGNSVVLVEGENKYTDIVSGFLKGKTEDGRYGRPCDIMMRDTRSFYFTDDLNGVLYYVSK